MIGKATAGAWVDAMLGALPEPVALVDEALVVAASNAALRRLIGADPDRQHLPALVAPEHADVLRDAALRATSAATPPVSLALVSHDGIRQPVQVRVSALQSAEITGALVTFFPASGTPGTQAPVDVATELAAALRSDQVVLHYQPVVRLDDHRPVLVEALVRWENPARGLLWPADFLAAADTPVLSGLLSQRVLREACHASAAWARGLPDGRRVQVGVNLSQRQLLQPGSRALVSEALTIAGCAADQLLLEVSESALLADPDAAEQALHGLKELGVDIAVDDLGTGSSSLSYLKRFPIDLVKIDRSLIEGVGRNTDQSAVVASLVSLAHAIGVPCVAEGVETADQLAVLRLLGCDLGQGHLFTRPMTSHAIGEWLARAHTTQPRSTRNRRAAPSTATVTRALDLQRLGASLHTVAARLNAEGHRNSDGRRWHHTSVAQLIAAERFPDLEI